MFKTWFNLFIVPAVFGASVINTTLSINPSGADLTLSPLPNALFHCVNNSQYPDWVGGISDGCDAAMRLISDRIESRRYISYTFYSKQAYPGRKPSGWPLPQGSESGNCAFLVRMVRDYAPDALPMANGRYYPTARSPKIQLDTWYHILRTAQPLYAGCMYDPDRDSSGWAVVSGSIVVSFWPRDSIMNERYGVLAELGADGSNVTFLSLS